MAIEDDIDKRAWMRSLPSYGPDWEAAIEFGIDVALIEANLALSFEDRLIQLEGMLALANAVRPRGPVLVDAPAA